VTIQSAGVIPINTKFNLCRNAHMDPRWLDTQKASNTYLWHSCRRNGLSGSRGRRHRWDRP